MDIWEKMYEKAKVQYHPEDVSPFIYAHNVVCAIEAENGEIYTGFCIESCSGVMDLCADRMAALNMYASSGQTKLQMVEEAACHVAHVESFIISLMKPMKIWKFWLIMKLERPSR